MKKLAALLVLLTASACSSTGQDTPKPNPAAPPAAGAPVQLTEADRAAVQTAVRTQLGSGTASFRTIIGQRDATGAVTICGYVNPGSGDTPFIGTLTGGAFTVTDLGGTTERTIAVQHACHARGIYV